MNEPTAERKYQAFISYSHAADGKLAPAIQTAVRRFGKQWYSPSSIQIFRDETGLSLTPDLWGEIQQRLEQSECFILLASPEAAQSQWVEKEIQFWLQHRAMDPLLILLTGGKLSWSNEQKDFDWTRTNALPRSLQGVFKHEPLWADLSWAEPEDLSLRKPRFFVEIAKLVAGIHQVPLDEVFNEAAAQQQKARRILWAAVAALAVLTIVAVSAASVSFRLAAAANRRQAAAAAAQRIENEQRAKDAASVRLAASASAVLTEDRELSALLALEALDIASTREAEDALRQTLLEEFAPPLVLHGHRDAVYSAQFSSDGKRVLTSSDDGTVRLWDVFSGTNILMLRVLDDTKSGDRAFGILSRDATMVLTMTRPESLAVGYWKSSGGPILYDAATGARLVEIPDQFAVNAALSPDKTQIATAGFDTSAKLWDAHSGKIQFELPGHEARVASISFNSNGNWVVTGSWDGTARVWDARTGGRLAVLRSTKGKNVDFATFSPDGTRVITLCDETKELLLWDWAKRPGEPVAVFTGHEGSIRDFAFSPDGKWLVTSSGDKTARIWETATGQCLQVLPGNEDFVNGVDFSPNSRWVVTASGDKRARVWAAATGESLMELGWNNFPRTCVAFSPDGKRIITGTIEGDVPIYTCDILGPAGELRKLAEARVRRKLTPEERRRYLNESPSK